jgi:hypothetical protein
MEFSMLYKRSSLFALAIAFSATVVSSSWAACRTDDIEIRQSDWHRIRDTIKIVGEFLNRCAEPAGVQLAFTFRDSAGKVVGVRELWPASIRNVEPNTTYPFELSVDGYVTASSMTVRVLEVRQWPDHK